MCQTRVCVRVSGKVHEKAPVPVRSERVFRSARLDGGELQVEHERLVHHVVARREHEVERALAREGGGLRADRLEAVR
eukprot:scaffold66205_cov64-Phaeocystis_antarctica.AAC.1